MEIHNQRPSCGSFGEYHKKPSLAVLIYLGLPAVGSFGDCLRTVYYRQMSLEGLGRLFLLHSLSKVRLPADAALLLYELPKSSHRYRYPVPGETPVFS